MEFVVSKAAIIVLARDRLGKPISPLPLPLRLPAQHYHNGTRSDPQNMAYRDIAKSQAHDMGAEKLAPGMYHSDERAPERWNASVKVRHHESVHMPEYKVRAHMCPVSR